MTEVQNIRYKILTMIIRKNGGMFTLGFDENFTKLSKSSIRINL